MLITKIYASKIPNHVRVQFDNESDYRYHLDLVLKYGLRKGIEINKVTYDLLTKDQEVFSAKQIAYRFATMKPRTEKQIKLKLKEKDINPEIYPIIMSFLKEFNLIDDYKFCKIYLENLIKKKGKSKSKALNELISKGVNKLTATEAINEFYPEDSTIDFAMKIVDRKLNLLSHKPIEKQKNSIIQALQREGYNFEIIRKIISESFPKI